MPRYIRQASQKLQDEFGGDVPKTADELCSLPGVGPKMAFLALQVAWKLYVLALSLNHSRHNKLLLQERWDWRRCACSPHHQQARVAQTPYQDTRGDEVYRASTRR